MTLRQASEESTADAVLLIGDRAMTVSPEPFHAVGLWYQDFSQTSDAEVRDLLASSAEQPAQRHR